MSSVAEDKRCGLEISLGDLRHSLAALPEASDLSRHRAKRRRSQQLDLRAHGAKRGRLEHRHEPRERVCGCCVGRGEAVTIGFAVGGGFAVELPGSKLLDAAAGCGVASSALGGMSAGGGGATGATVGGMSATSVWALVLAEPATSFIARADQTMSSKPTLPPARYMRASV